MAAVDKKGQAFEIGRKIKVASDGKEHSGGSNPKGSYEGEIVGLHEDGPHVAQKDGTRTTPFAADCEVV
jgi:hypothetical protein